MAKRIVTLGSAAAAFLIFASGVQAESPSVATAGPSSADDLMIVSRHASTARIVSFPKAGPFEKRAARDLAAYIQKMTGVSPAIIDKDDEIDRALASDEHLIVLGQEAFRLREDLKPAVLAATKPKPYLRADGIILKRDGHRLYVAGSNDRSHYFAVSELLRQWGVRWYMPGPFGECVPAVDTLAVGKLDKVEATPFEVRTFAVAWLGDQTGITDFQLHNMMTDVSEVPPAGHSLGRYTKGLGTSAFDVSLLAPETAKQVADGTDKLFAASRNFSLAMEDGIYQTTDPKELEKRRLQWDAPFHAWAITDPMLTLYGNVLKVLREKHPRSGSKIGFLAYSNMTLPPVEPHELDRALYAELAPIAVDPNHGIGDPRSPERNEYARNLEKWSKAMDGRVTIYDYDQSMLVWRDLPNPSHMAFERDVKFYAKAGILGVNTESRNALATTFINFYLRARLLWDPQQKVEPLLDEFYTTFYGPAAKPMAAYWGKIFEAWKQTKVTEHEYFLAPAIYTRPLVESLRASLDDADRSVHALTMPGHSPTPAEQLFLDRLRFTRLSFKLIDDYTRMVDAAARDADYKTAVEMGERGLGVRAELTGMNKSFTTVALERGSMFWPGEVQQYEDLRTLTNGQRGSLVARLPLQWNVHRVAGQPFDPAKPDAPAEPKDLAEDADKDPAQGWQPARTDLYLEAQGLYADAPKDSGAAVWYRSTFDLASDDTLGRLRIHFPGVFGSCRLYVNGKALAERRQNVMWWLNDYRFDWDVPLAKAAVKGANAVTLSCASDGHQSGIFRRPFIYEMTEASQ